MARPRLTRPMQAAVVMALLVAAILVWVGAPRRQHNAAPTAVIDSVSTTVVDVTKPDSVEQHRKSPKKVKKKAPPTPPKSRDYLDERVN